jgi:transcriptional regulator with XRE-family HTH domain
LKRPSLPIPRLPGDQDEEATPLRIAFGEKLRQARVRANLTQTEVADRVGLHQAYVSKLERGRVNVTFSLLERVCAVVGVEPGALLMPQAMTVGMLDAVVTAVHHTVERILKQHDQGTPLTPELISDVLHAVHASVTKVLVERSDSNGISIT